ncbi:ABC-type sugar transport system, auxiliary component [Pseudomonas asplenii]|nr:ABC-type sugar transport system, auxiliary component [Pseudomonas fuscovaginae]
MILPGKGKHVLLSSMLGLVALFSVALVDAADSNSVSPPDHYSKKYTNAQFYKDGVFQKDVAKKAVEDMLDFYKEDYTSLMDSKIWVSDFGLGDFEHVGLSSVTWFNSQKSAYFAMTMYLLPGQMIPEHIHRPISIPPAKPAKDEAWRVFHGFVYNFSEVGSVTKDTPPIPSSFGPVHSGNMTILKKGEISSLKKIETWHFMMAGPEGAVVDEYGSNHDRRGWFSSNPKVHPTD